jgi:hypothetical protein
MREWVIIKRDLTVAIAPNAMFDRPLRGPHCIVNNLGKLFSGAHYGIGNATITLQIMTGITIAQRKQVSITAT